MTVDEAMKLFSIDETGDGKFSFKCKKHGCSSVFKMTATDTHCNMSNVHRHIETTCWLSSSGAGGSKAQDLEKKSTQSTISDLFNKSQNPKAYDHLLNRGPPPPGVNDFTIQEPCPKVAKIQTQNNDSPSPSNQDATPKNLQTPAGQQDMDVFSGR